MECFYRDQLEKNRTEETNPQQQKDVGNAGDDDDEQSNHESSDEDKAEYLFESPGSLRLSTNNPIFLVWADYNILILLIFTFRINIFSSTFSIFIRTYVRSG